MITRDWQTLEEFEMPNHQMNVVVHVKETLVPEQLAALQAALGSLDGVTQARTSARLSRLMLVDYDPSVVSAQAILQSVTRRGLSAQLVGM
jgi:sensor domain CHASE-containing protein